MGLFIFKSTVISAEAYGLKYVFDYFQGNAQYNKQYEHEKYMQKFAFDVVMSDLREQFGLDKYNSCRVIAEKTTNQSPYLIISALDEDIERLLPTVVYIAAEYDLIVYDSKLEKTYYHRELDREKYKKVKARAKTMLEVITKEECPYRIDKLEECISEYCDAHLSYVVTVKKNEDSFEARTERFGRLLERGLISEEKIETENGCFEIIGDNYIISFVYEGYKKNADRMGYTSEGKPIVKKFHRAGCVRIKKQFESLMSKRTKHWKETMYKGMRMKELIYKYPNSADRYVALYKIQKEYGKYSLCFSPFDSGGELVLSKVFPGAGSNNGFQDDESPSFLVVDWEFVPFVVLCINKHYPYLYKRDMLTPNYLPDLMWYEILKDLKKTYEMLHLNAFSEESLRYMRKYKLKDFWDDKKKFVKAIRVLALFIQWIELQLECECYYSRGFSINVEVEE